MLRKEKSIVHLKENLVLEGSGTLKFQNLLLFFEENKENRTYFIEITTRFLFIVEVFEFFFFLNVFLPFSRTVA